MSVSIGEPASGRTKRINCRNCGYRIRNDAEICPHCHVDPHKRRPLPSNLLIAILLILVLAFVCVLGSQFLASPLTQFVAQRLRPQPTRVIQIIYAVATQVPTGTSTATPLPTPTPSPRFSPSPTRKGAPTPTATRPAPSPTSSDYGTPKLTAPANNANFTGAGADIVLEWQSVVASGLGENEWYLVTLSYTARDSSAASQRSWSRETRWSVPQELYSNSSPSARTFSWNVQLMRIEGADPLASPLRLPASQPSETRKFIWQ